MPASSALRRTLTLLTTIFLVPDSESGPTRDQLQRLVRLCGPTQPLWWLAQAQAIVATHDPADADLPALGELFLQVAEEDLRQTADAVMYQLIFELSAGALPPRAAPPWPEPTFWSLGAPSLPGELTMLQLMLIGTPTQIVTRPTLTVLRLDAAGSPPPLPKDLPIPQTIPPTTYLVLLSATQWQRVAAAVRRGDDPLVVQGWPYYDPDRQAVFVLAQQVATQRQRRYQRQFQDELDRRWNESDSP